MNEFELYEKIKHAFSVEKGKILMLEITSKNISELVPEIINRFEDCIYRIRFFEENYKPYAIFDYLEQDYLIYEFKNKIFKKVEVIATGEILDFIFYGEDKPISKEDLKKDLEKLKYMLKKVS